MIEYRICWSASSNISFQGQTDWTAWDEPDATPDDVERALEGYGQRSNFPAGFEEALEASGFEWYSEVREVSEAPA
jgi:phage gp45-like